MKITPAEMMELLAFEEHTARRDSDIIKNEVLNNRLVTWVRTINRDQGVAPHTGLVIEARENMREECSDFDDEPSMLRLDLRTSAGRMWAWRWRRRPMVLLRKPRLREDLDEHEIRQKAPDLSVRWSSHVSAVESISERHCDSTHGLKCGSEKRTARRPAFPGHSYQT